MSADPEPVAFDGFGGPIYGWAVADRTPEDTRAALAEVRARLEADEE